MASNSEWREMEHGIGRDACRFESNRYGTGSSVVLSVWLAFYVLAMVHTIVANRAASLVTAEIEAPARTRAVDR